MNLQTDITEGFAQDRYYPYPIDDIRIFNSLPIHPTRSENIARRMFAKGHRADSMVLASGMMAVTGKTRE